MLKQFDLFPKLKEESRRTTSEGGVISIIGILIGILLFSSELVDFLQPKFVEHLELYDPLKIPGAPLVVSIHLEILFFHLTCPQLSLQASSETTTQDNPGSWEIRSRNAQPTEDGQGCLLNAMVEVVKYESGEMHVALSPHSLGGQDEGFTIEEYFMFNASHVLKHFSISSTNQKEGKFHDKIVPESGTGRFIYDFNVVPTKNNAHPINPIEFAFQCREQDVITNDLNEGMFALQRLGLPGVFFTVKFSNLMMETNVVEKNVSSFLITLLGILGGVPALIAFVDSFLHEALWKNKLD